MPEKETQSPVVLCVWQILGDSQYAIYTPVMHACSRAMPVMEAPCLVSSFLISRPHNKRQAARYRLFAPRFAQSSSTLRLQA